MASVVIEPAPGLAPAARARARQLGPGQMSIEGTLAGRVESAGLELARVEDWTGELESTVRGVLTALDTAEEELRRLEGDEAFEHERGKKRRLLDGVRQGLLRRTLAVAVRPDDP